MNPTRLLPALPLLLASVACEQVESANVRTDGIYADFDAVAEDSERVQVKANLRVGGRSSNTYLDLVDGDRLEARHGLDVEQMDKDTSVFGAIHYDATFDYDDGDRTFRVAFLREPHDSTEAECRGASAPDSVVVLPRAFEPELATSEDRLSRDEDDVVLRWSPPTDGDIRVSLSGTCIESWSRTVDDDGHLRIEAGDLDDAPRPDDTPRQSCRVEVTLTRESEGRVDSAFGEGGRFEAKQVRRLSFSSVP